MQGTIPPLLIVNQKKFPRNKIFNFQVTSNRLQSQYIIRAAYYHPRQNRNLNNFFFIVAHSWWLNRMLHTAAACRSFLNWEKKEKKLIGFFSCCWSCCLSFLWVGLLGTVWIFCKSTIKIWQKYGKENEKNFKIHENFS